MADIQTNASEPIFIDVEAKHVGFAKGAGKVLALLLGIAGVITSFILFITIIGILPAIGLFYVSILLFYVAAGKQKIACPRCSKTKRVLQTTENFTCDKCRQFTVINWK